MKDDGVSEVIGTILLFAIVILAAGIVSISLTAEIANAGESFPTVSFRESASPNYLYHAGGDALSKSEIRIFAGSKDITEKTTINGASWEIWKTGEALFLGKHRTEEITIIGRTSAGREVLLFEGLRE